MPKRNVPEFQWIEARQEYRKSVKDPLTGKYCDLYAKTKAELREKVAAKLRSGTGDVLVAEYAARWYKLNTAGLSEKRKADYANAINKHICPHIGAKAMQDVRPDDLKAIILDAPPSKSAQQKIVLTIKRIFDSALENGLIDRSPAITLKAGGKKAAEKIPLTDKQAETLTEAVKGTRAYLFVMLGLYAGLRREEIAGLKWDCVHLDAETPFLEVRRAVRWPDNKQPILTEDLKSEKAKRMIPLAEQLRTALREAKEGSKSEFVCPGKNGKAMSYSSFDSLWGSVRARTVADGESVGDKVQNHPIDLTIDFHVSPHILRHTFVTNLLKKGVPIKTVQYLAGHATADITMNIYAHLMENQPADTVGAINAAFS